MAEYDKIKKKEFFSSLAGTLMTGHLSTTEDGWTCGKAKQHYTSTSASFVARSRVKNEVNIHELSMDDIKAGNLSVQTGERLVLTPTTLVLDFSISSAVDKAAEVASGFEEKLGVFGLKLANVCLATLDGVSAG